jgi:hypothetical protein
MPPKPSLVASTDEGQIHSARSYWAVGFLRCRDGAGSTRRKESRARQAVSNDAEVFSCLTHPLKRHTLL